MVESNNMEGAEKSAQKLAAAQRLLELPYHLDSESIFNVSRPISPNWSHPKRLFAVIS